MFTWNILSFCLSTSETSMAWLGVVPELECWWFTITWLAFCSLIIQRQWKQRSPFSTLLHGFLAQFRHVYFVLVFCFCWRVDFHKFSYLCFQASTVTQRSVSVSRTSNNDADIKAGKTPKKKNKKRDQIEKDPFMATLASIKKDMGIHDITTEKSWSTRRYVSKFYNHVLHLITFFSCAFLNTC